MCLSDTDPKIFVITDLSAVLFLPVSNIIRIFNTETFGCLLHSDTVDQEVHPLLGAPTGQRNVPKPLPLIRPQRGRWLL